MSFRRYIAPNSRDAMAQVRRELGDEAVILSSKRIGDEYEIVAAAPHAMERLVEAAPVARVALRRAAPPPAPTPAAPAKPLTRPGESFQEFVRRQAQSNVAARAPQASTAAARSAASYRAVAQAAAVPAEDEDDIWKPTTFHVPPARAAGREAVFQTASTTAPPAASSRIVHEVAEPLVPARLAQRTPQPAAPAPSFGASTRLPTRRIAPEVAAAPPAVFRRRIEVLEPAEESIQSVVPAVAAPIAVSTPAPVATTPVVSASMADPKLMDELQAMRAQLQQQLASLSSTVAASRQELQARIAQVQAAARGYAQTNSGRVMTRMLTAGFSPEVARKVALHAPAQAALPELEAWLQDVITLNLKIAGPEASIVETGGAYALVGPTGVGKTTTVAKLAAQFAVRYGAGALGLITLDAYRVGAHEQLRTYGRILGAPVHLAQDGATLRELMVSMQTKRLVLIDTCGVSQRDGRLNEVLSMLSTGTQGVPEAMHIKRLLLANAASHAETLDDAARAWRAPECAGCVFTKLDEAARIGGAIDMALRYKQRVFGVTNGQRVPEDWHAANARVLTHLALRPGSDTFALADNEAMALAAEPKSLALH